MYNTGLEYKQKNANNCWQAMGAIQGKREGKIQREDGFGNTLILNF